MSTRIIEPDGLYINPGWTRTGAASDHLALSDDSDASYMTPPLDTVPTHYVTLASPPAPPPLSQIRSVHALVRIQDPLGAGAFACRFALGATGAMSAEMLTGSAPAAATTVPLGLQTTAPDGGPWTEEKLADLIFGCRLYAGNTGVRYIDLDVVITDNEAPVATAVTPAEGVIVTTTTRPSFTWSYADPENNAQERARVRVFSAAQYGIGGFDPKTSPSTWDSDWVLTSSTTMVCGVDLSTDTYRWYVEVADVGSGGRAGPIDSNTFSVLVDVPGRPAVVATEVANTKSTSLTLQGQANHMSPNQASVETDTTGYVVGSGTEFLRHAGDIKEVPVVRSAATTNSASVAASIAVVMPAGFVAGDMLILQVAVTGDRTVTTPAGWTLLTETANGAAATDTRQIVYYKAAAGGEAPVLVVSGATPLSATCIAIQTGTYTGNPYGGGQANASNTTCTAPSQNTTAVGAQILNFYAINNAAATTFSAGTQQPTEISDIDSGGAIAIAAYSTPVGRFAGTARTAIATTAGPNVGQTVAINGVTAIAVPHGNAYVRFTITSGSTAARNVTTPIGTAGFPVVAGKTYTSLVDGVRALVALGKGVRAVIRWYKADGSASATTVQSVGATVVVGTAPVLVFCTATAPADAAFAAFEFITANEARFVGEMFIIDRMAFYSGSEVIWSRGGLKDLQDVTVERSADLGITWETVPFLAAGLATATPVRLVGASYAATVYDHHAPRGVPLRYRAKTTAVENGLTLASAWSAESAVTLSMDDWHLKHPTRPWMNTRIEVAPGFRIAIREPQEVIDVLGSDEPLHVTDGVKGLQLSVPLWSKDKAMFDAVFALLVTGDVLLLQDNLGRQWWVKTQSGASFDRLRAVDPLGTYQTRHFHSASVEFVTARVPA